MSLWGAIKLRTASGGIVFEGEASPAPGGGSVPVQALYTGNAVNIGDGLQDALTFDTLSDGTELLDRSTPALPVFLAAGTYAITAVYFAGAALTAGGFAAASVNTGGVHATSATDTSDHPEWQTTVPLLAVVDAGDTLQVFITNNDGAAARDYTLNGLTLVKLA